MPVLELRDAITICTGVATLSGVVWTLRASVNRLEAGQTEVLRQVAALHKRLDEYGRRISKSEIEHAVLTERVDNLRSLRDSQRFKLREPPMFKDAQGEDG